MNWLPRVRYPYIITNIYVAIARTLLPALIFLKGVTMFASIPEINIVASISAIAVLAWVMLVQYSRYTAHIKDNQDNPENLALATDYAVIPYGVIPALFAGIAAFAALAVTDWSVIHGYIHTVDECLALSVFLSIVIDCVLAHYLVNQVGNAVYFATIESKVASAAKDIAEAFPDDIDEKDLKLLRLIKAFKE